MSITVPPPTASLDDKYLAEDRMAFMSGVQALVRVLLDQLRADRDEGLRSAAFVSGYQGSPLGTFDKEVHRQVRHAPEDGSLVHVRGLNEELAATSVWGTQLAQNFKGPRFDGVIGAWYGKAPGLDRASDAIRHGNYVGTTRTGGAVAFVGDDPSCKSSSLPSASEGTLASLFVPTFYPGNLQEVLDYGRHAIACSRASGTWSAMKMVTNVADGAGTVEVGHGRLSPVLPDLEWEGRPYRHTPSAHLLAPPALDFERTLLGVRLPLAERYARLNRVNAITVDGDRAELGLIAAGKAYYDLRDALSSIGLDERELERAGIRILKLGMVFPLEPEIVTEFAHGLKEIVVVEDKGPWLERAVRDCLYGMPDAPPVYGKRGAAGATLLPATGELDADVIADALLVPLEGRVSVDLLDAARERVSMPPATPATVARTPYFCSGCPHNRSTVVEDGTNVGVGIGCHTLVLVARDGKGELAGMTQMGGEGAQWIGISPFTETEHFVQNMGDGTFHHSGSLAVRAAVAAKANVTYKILYNSAVAMTGGQDVEGVLSVADLTRWLALEGVRRVIVTTEEPERYRGVQLDPIAELRDRSQLPAAQRELAAVEGVTVLVHDQQCAAEKRRLRKRGKLADPVTRVHINERVCEGCGDCGKKSSCLSVQPVATEFGRKTQIHQASCNKDYSCLDGDCPSFLTVIPGKKARAGLPAAPPLRLPEPAAKVDADDFTVRLMGIGGSGVVTVSQILGMAAMLDGRHSWNLDQTGVSQKGGPVISDVRVSREPRSRSNKATAAAVDLYLGLDLLGAADAKNLRTAGRDRTIAVVSTSQVPTGRMITDTAAGFPELESLVVPIEAVTRAADNVFLDAQRAAQALFADDMPANAFMLGAAYQAGALPLGFAAIEEAFRINGAAVEKNLLAFAWGRAAVADPGAVADVIDPQPATTVPDGHGLVAHLGDGLRETVALRVDELVPYADRRYAQRYVEAVDRVAAVEAARTGGTLVTEAYARNLYKLMAYKDEYEVARLHLDAAEQARVTAEFGDDAKVYWHLHPPVFRALGMKRKLKLGPWFRHAFVTLRSMRRLRGTRLDVFGYAEVRRVERSLPSEYTALVERALDGLTAQTLSDVLALTELPDVVRGYEDIKLGNVERFRDQARELVARVESPPAADSQPFALPMVTRA